MGEGGSKSVLNHPGFKRKTNWPVKYSGSL